MGDKSFLLKAYSGDLNIDQLRVFQDIEMDDRSHGLIQRFLELQEEYPAAVLDEKGVIPPEAMERLRQIGFFGLNIPETYGGLGLNI